MVHNSQKQCLPDSTGPIHIELRNYDSMHSFRQDKIPALRRGIRHKVPPITKKDLGGVWEGERMSKIRYMKKIELKKEKPE